MEEEPFLSPELKKFFLDLTQRSFAQLGIPDRQIIDYVATMLTEFARSDRFWIMRDAEGRRINSVVDMLMAQLAPTDGSTRMVGERAVRKYVGDYTLFMSGLFRGYVERCGYLGYYLDEGKKSYQAVSKLDVSLYRPGFMIFEELSRGFEGYSGALDFMRKCYFRADPGHNPFAGF